MLSTEIRESQQVDGLTLVEQGQIWDAIREIVTQEQNPKLQSCLMDVTGGIRTYLQYHLLENRYGVAVDSRRFLHAMGERLQDIYLRKLSSPQEVIEYANTSPILVFMRKCRDAAEALCPNMERQAISDHETMLQILKYMFGPVKE